MMASAANERGSYYPLCVSEHCHSSSSGVIVGDLAACLTAARSIPRLNDGTEAARFVLFGPIRPRLLTCLFRCHLLDLAAQQRSGPSLCGSLCLTPEDEGVPRDVQLNLGYCQQHLWLCWNWQRKVRDTVYMWRQTNKFSGSFSMALWFLSSKILMLQHSVIF